MQRGRLPCVISEHAEHPQLVAAGAADRRAHVERIELRQFLEMLLDQIGEFLDKRTQLFEDAISLVADLEIQAGSVERAEQILTRTLEVRSEDLDERLTRFSSLLDQSLEGASDRTREIARLVAEFGKVGLKVAQVLLTHADLADRERYRRETAGQRSEVPCLTYTSRAV